MVKEQKTVMEQAWGIPFTPEEFIQEAVNRGHPKLISTLVPPVLMEAVFTISKMGTSAIYHDLEQSGSANGQPEPTSLQRKSFRGRQACRITLQTF